MHIIAKTRSELSIETSSVEGISGIHTKPQWSLCHFNESLYTDMSLDRDMDI